MRLVSPAFALIVCALCDAAAAQDGAPESFWSATPYPDGAACAGGPSGPQIESGGDYSGMDFSGAVWVGLNLTGVDLTGAALSGAVLCDVRLAGASLDGADLTGVRIEHSDFVGVSARGVRLDGAVVLATQIIGDLSGASLRDARLICDATFLHSDCARTPDLNLDGADLTGATLVGLGEGVSLDEARVEGARVDYLLVPALNAAQFETVALAPDPVTDRPAESFSAGEIAALASGWDERIPVRPAGPGFDCDAASTQIELSVCFDSGLSALDAVMSRLYARARDAGAPGLLEAQRAWLTRRDAECVGINVVACLHHAYEARIEELLPLAPLALPRPGLYRPAVSFAWAPISATGDPLGDRFAALMENTSDTLALTFPDEETFHVEGFAWGANGHTCSLSADLSGDPALGVYRNDIEDADFPEEGVRIVPLGDLVWFAGGRAWCGMRAGWADVWLRAED